MRFVIIDFGSIMGGAFGSVGLATLLTQRGHETRVVGGGGVRDILGDPARLKSVLKSVSPGAVGLSVYTPHADNIDRVGEVVRDALGAVPIILGGYHATIFKRAVFNETRSVDFVALGDADESLPALLDELEAGNSYSLIPGVVSRHGAGRDGPAAIQVTESLNNIPFPDESVVHSEYARLVRFTGPLSVPRPSRYVLFSRGCPFQCSFCKLEDDAGFRGTVRFFDAKRAVEHIGVLQERYRLKGLGFQDDNFMLNKKWAYELCDGLTQNNIRLQWHAQARANLMDVELLRAMRRAGCVSVAITVESGNDRIRNEVMRKKVSRDQLRTAYAVAREVGLLVQGSLMMGSPTETYDELLDSVSFYRDLDPDWGAPVLTTILPGTAMHREYRDRIRVRCYADYDVSPSVQESHYQSDEVKLAFHSIPPERLLETLHQVDKEYSSYRQMLPRWRNLTSKRRFVWMARMLRNMVTLRNARLAVGKVRRDLSTLTRRGGPRASQPTV